MKIYFMLILLAGLAVTLSGCSDLISDEQSEGPYDIQHRIELQNNFIPVMIVNVTGTPREVDIELTTPNNNVSSKHIFAGNFTQNTGTVKFVLEEAGEVPPSGGYEVLVKSNQQEVISSKNFNLDGPNLVVTDSNFNITEQTINRITLVVKNEGELPGFIQLANIKVGNLEPKGWLFTRGISPQGTTTLNIPRQFEIGDTTHVNVWLYYQGELVSSYETDVSSQ